MRYYVTAVCGCFVEADDPERAVQKARDGEVAKVYGESGWQCEDFEVEEAGDNY